MSAPDGAALLEVGDRPGRPQKPVEAPGGEAPPGEAFKQAPAFRVDPAGLPSFLRTQERVGLRAPLSGGEGAGLQNALPDGRGGLSGLRRAPLPERQRSEVDLQVDALAHGPRYRPPVAADDG